MRNLTVVTSFPNLTRQFFGTRNVPFDLLVRAGRVEKYVRKGRAQACIDITSSGKSMRNNGIEPYDILLESEATLIASPLLKQKRGSERLVEDFLISIVSAIRARDFRGIIGTPQQQIFPNRDDRVIMEMLEKIYD